MHQNEDGSYGQVPYAAYFPVEVASICDELDDWIAGSLQVVCAQMLQQQAFWNDVALLMRSGMPQTADLNRWAQC